VIDELIEQLTAPVVSDIIRVYLRTAPEHLDALKQGVERGDLHKVRGTLHSLKSSTRSLGGTELGDLAAEGERRARSGDNGAFALLQPITVAMDAFCRALSTHPCMASET
jgi:HPt (histidine-containing phosphotransfer) domain-containing protein